MTTFLLKTFRPKFKIPNPETQNLIFKHHKIVFYKQKDAHLYFSSLAFILEIHTFQVLCLPTDITVLIMFCIYSPPIFIFIFSFKTYCFKTKYVLGVPLPAHQPPAVATPLTPSSLGTFTSISAANTSFLFS